MVNASCSPHRRARFDGDCNNSAPRAALLLSDVGGDGRERDRRRQTAKRFVADAALREASAAFVCRRRRWSRTRVHAIFFVDARVRAPPKRGSDDAMQPREREQNARDRSKAACVDRRGAQSA